MKPLVSLQMEICWIAGGPVAILQAEDTIFHLRKSGKNGSYLLSTIEAESEREVCRIEASDPQFANRILVAIGEAGGRGL